MYAIRSYYDGGRAEELGIEPGDEVIHPIFGNADE